MLRQRVTQRYGRTLVEQYAHLYRGERASCHVLKHCTDLFESDTRKPFHELRDKGAVFNILE